MWMRLVLPDYPVSSTRRVSKAKRGRAHARPMAGSACPPFPIRGWMVGTVQERLCPPYRLKVYAARTLTRNSSTALRSMPDWLSSSRAFASTSDAALPVAAAAVVTPPIWLEISFDPAATD
jgi:hypothetical protein